MDATRREILAGGCAALAALALSGEARAAGGGTAPRVGCPHDLCRHHRPGEDGHGICGLSLSGDVLPRGPWDDVPHRPDESGSGKGPGRASAEPTRAER